MPLVSIVISLSVQAQTYPGKPIRIIVPYAAGGTSDILARQIGPKLTDAWGQPIIVENKPGANGNVGADFVAKSAPDGYTLLLTDLGGLVISASVYPKLPFNPAKDFTPVVMVSYSPHVLAVNPEVQVKNVKELVAMAKAYPGKLNFAISGIGGAPQLAGIEFAQRMGIDWTYIPYKGGADAVTGVIQGQAHVLFNGMLATWPHVTGGRLRAIAISSASRVPSAPGHADRRRAGPGRLRDRLVPGRGRPARPAARHRRQAERRARQSAQYRRDEGALRQAGHRGAHRHAGEPRPVDDDRAGEVGQGGEGIRSEV